MPKPFRSMITPQYYAMKPFRTWVYSASYLCAGLVTVIHNVWSPVTGKELKYNVFI